MKYLLYFFLLANLVLFLWHGAVPTAQDLPRPPAEVHQDSLRLLAEINATPRAAAPSAAAEDPTAGATAASLATEQAAGRAAAASCYTLGPFDEDRQSDVDRRLRERLANVQQRQITEQEQYGYQVFIPSLPSLVRARRVAAQLKQQGFTDYFIMTGDTHPNGISLGLFREKRYASRHLDAVRGKGFDAVMEPRYRERVRYWFNYRDDQGQIDENVLRELTDGRPIQRLQHDCRGLV